MNPLIPRAAKPAQEAQLAEQQETREREMQVWLGRNTIEQLQRRCACHSFRFDRVYVVCIYGWKWQTDTQTVRLPP